MTGKHDKLRSLFLTALMVMSVFAMTVTFAGSAAAANQHVDIQSAVEYEDSGTNYIEITLNQTADGSEDVQIIGDLAGDVTVTGVSGTGTQTITATISDDVTPNENLSIEVDGDGGGTFDATATDIEVTSSSVVEAGTAKGSNVYQGENIALVADTANDEISIAGGSTTVSTTLQNGNTVYTYDTSGLDTGSNYTVTFEGPTEDYFQVYDLGLSVSADSSLTSDDTISADVSSNADGTATVELLDSNGDEVETESDVSLTGGKTTTVDFASQDAGNYTVQVTEHETGNTAETDTIVVEDAATDDAVFSPNVIQEHRGDVADITVNTTGTDDATVVIGDSSNGYYLHANVTDDDGDGQITLQFNTYLAGADQGSGQNAGSITGADVLTSSDDTVVDATQAGDYTSGTNWVGNDTIDAGSYSMNVSTGHSTIQNMDQTDVGTLSIRERSTNNLTAMVAPMGADYTGWDAAAVQGNLGSSITTADEIADADIAVFELDASGLEGAVDYRANATDVLFNGTMNELDFTVAHTNPGMNSNAVDLALDNSNTELIADPANDTYFIAVDVSNANVADGRNYNATVDTNGTLGDDNSDADVFDTFSKVGEDTSLDTNADDLVSVQPAAGQNITGSTNLAPGTEFTVQIESSDASSPFLITPSATVNADGTYSASTDEFQDIALGTNFSVDVKRGSSTLASADGRVMEAPTPTPTETTEEPTETTEEPTETTEEPTETTEEPTDETTPTDEPVETTEDTGPGFGIAVGLIALIGAALLAARRQN